MARIVVGYEGDLADERDAGLEGGDAFRRSGESEEVGGSDRSLPFRASRVHLRQQVL